MNQTTEEYWKKFFGIEIYKIKYFVLYFLYKYLGIKLPKLKSQYDYWADRGQVYMDEILASGYLGREVFFQNLIVDEMKKLEFSSCFEAGCGFGWNLKRIKGEMPEVAVGGLDFSLTQLLNSKKYLAETPPVGIVNGDNCRMPFKDNSFDIGFSVGVFMNINPDKILDAFREMIRVCSKYIIHVEYDENHTTDELREKRAFKTNIVSHDYIKLYSDLGVEVAKLLTYKVFEEQFYEFQRNIEANLDRWEGFEGPEKYIIAIIKV